MKNKLEPEEFEQLPVGDTFILSNTELEVVAQIGCAGCFLAREGIYCTALQECGIIPQCRWRARADKNQVIFKEVEDGQ